MSLSDAKAALAAERDTLKRDLDKIDAALAALNGKPAEATPTPKSKSKPKPKKKKSRQALEAEAIDHYGADAVTCPECGKITTRPQGLSAHLRSHSS